MTSSNNSPVPCLQHLDELYQRQLQRAAAEVAAALAHAAGTPLNVIGGRVELIRQDPANAAAHLDRIEQQVRRLAEGLRRFVEYLTPQEPAPADVPATQVFAQLAPLLEPIARSQQVDLELDGAELGSAQIEPHVLANLFTLTSWALHCTSSLGLPGSERLVLKGASAPTGATFELTLRVLTASTGWRIDHFDPDTPLHAGEPYRMLAICAAIARAQNGKLQVDSLTDGGVRIRLLCRSSG